MRINSTAVNISWDPISPETARGFIVQYSVVYQVVDGTDSHNVLVGPTLSYFVITGLDPGKMYAAIVAGITSAGEGVQSALTYEAG